MLLSHRHRLLEQKYHRAPTVVTPPVWESVPQNKFYGVPLNSSSQAESNNLSIPQTEAVISCVTLTKKHPGATGFICLSLCSQNLLLSSGSLPPVRML